MMFRPSILVLAVTAFALALPPSGFADDKAKDEHAPGGAAAEHRSDKADERSNAQWSDDAEKGKERAAEHHESASKGKAKHAGAEKHGAAKKGGAAKHGDGAAKQKHAPTPHKDKKDKAGHGGAAKSGAPE